MNVNWGYAAKSVIGAGLAALTAAQVAEQSPGITAGEWITIGIAGLATAGGVFVTSNTPGRLVVRRPSPLPPRPPGAHEAPVVPPA